jgi:hypothetical protein
MSDFVRTFLNEDWENLPGAPHLYVGAFGKHPGWNDHLDDIGLLTGSLATLRQVLYGSGIASQIESAAWDKAGPEKTLAGFDHLLVWTRPGEAIVGQMTASKDGKGRARYPMVVVAHCIGMSFDRIADEVLPALEKAAAQCGITTTPLGVLGALNEAQQSLRGRLSAPSEMVQAIDSQRGIEAWTAHFFKDRLPLQRLFYHMESNLRMFEPGSEEWCQGTSPARSRVLRVPVVPGASNTDTLNAWLSFLGTQLEPAVPLLGLLPRGQPWLDVIVGEPAPADFFALRANLVGMPLITEIPYQIDSTAANRYSRAFNELAVGRLPNFSVLNDESLNKNRDNADKWLAKFRPGARKGLFSRLLSSSSSSVTRFDTRSLGRG